MNKDATDHSKKPLLVSGTGPLAAGITVCLLQAGHPVAHCTTDPAADGETIANLQQAHAKHGGAERSGQKLTLGGLPEKSSGYAAAIIAAPECLATKRSRIAELEAWLPQEAIIAVNTECIALSRLQEGAGHPARIIGANWAEPAHTTQFLEMIVNTACKEACAHAFRDMAVGWGKDPYVVPGDEGIRSRMMSAMAREAFFLVSNGYASVEDIDRACRNDAGYYLPFAGNFRYMDLMGPYAYGLVMEDLNPGLDRSEGPPAWMDELLHQGHTGMDAGKGFYDYGEGEAEKWASVFNRFSYRIRQLMHRYPFGDNEKTEP
ncbi:3-hydroxyacyl-CoA dehydrogenase NAD-binding domain-containing protein [Chitinophaga sp.]|uniref:3-hydroxyacyl-CoA dehydrogenase family protein n=1 Tax=Chitinophaga sp. TaxID=1869181 RepID=UPI00261EE167|nr:3-hydroxyacyl-CoA dehydrogenase NAD-binding domain-containing protein [uncultured Chitinophaga sp.]